MVSSNTAIHGSYSEGQKSSRIAAVAPPTDSVQPSANGSEPTESVSPSSCPPKTIRSELLLIGTRDSAPLDFSAATRELVGSEKHVKVVDTTIMSETLGIAAILCLDCEVEAMIRLGDRLERGDLGRLRGWKGILVPLTPGKQLDPNAPEYRALSLFAVKRTGTGEE